MISSIAQLAQALRARTTSAVALARRALEVARANPARITYVEHERNGGKGAALRTGIALARGSVTVIQDADLEYDPADLPRLLVPFERSGIDCSRAVRTAL